jgi:hypothetical protein
MPSFLRDVLALLVGSSLAEPDRPVEPRQPDVIPPAGMHWRRT